MQKDAAAKEAPKKKFSFPKISWKNPVVIAILVLLIIFIVKFASVGLMIFNMISHPRPAPTVTTAKAKEETWPEYFSAVAQLKSENGALLKAELPGVLSEIAVTPGQEVKKDDLLLVISGSGERAAARMAKLTLERQRELREKNVNTQSDLDQAEAAYEQAASLLDKKEIRAPFDGEVGIPQVFVGQYVTVGMPLIAVESRKTIYADFGVPQENVSKLEKDAEVNLTVDAYPADVFKGKVEGVDPRVDDATLTVGVRAALDNKEGKLLSGMFGSINVTLKETRQGVAIPSSAIVYSAYGNAVYVLSPGEDPQTKKKATLAKQSFVKILATQGDYVLVSGIKEGDEVVTAGQMKLRNGAAVQVDNAQALPAEKKPQVQES